MVSVGIKELKEKLSSYVAKVRHGEEVVVTDRGREIAVISPISRERGAVKDLMEKGKGRWSGGKPAGLRGVKAKGAPLSRTVLEERR